jgi:CubicO group peptidase (beta-lactamase class C family)
MLTAIQERRLDELIELSIGQTFPACQLTVLASGDAIYQKAFGYLDPDTRQTPTQLTTRFDLASLTMLFTATSLMTFVDQGLISLDQPVRDLLPEFSGIRLIAAHPFRDAPGEPIDLYPRGSKIDARRVTLRHLLAHNSGLPAWLPLHIVRSNMLKAERSALHIEFMLRDMVTGTMFSYPPGQRVVFSDVGFMLLGFVLERIGRKPLRQVLRERVVDRLGLLSACFGDLPCEDVAPTDLLRNDDDKDVDEKNLHRLCGEVHDQNAAAFDGVAGHSGVFAHSGDVARLGEMYRTGGAPLLSPEIVAEMIIPHAEDGSVRRGLGFALHSPNELATSSPLSSGSFGHLGFTGSSLWVDPGREMVIACLTNHAYYGKANDENMNAFRLALHRALAEMVPVRH